MKKFIGAREDEIFVGNVPTAEGIRPYLQGLRTARIGEQALDIDGNKLDPNYMRPLFIGRSEADAYDEIMMRRTFPGQYR